MPTRPPSGVAASPRGCAARCRPRRSRRRSRATRASAQPAASSADCLGLGGLGARPRRAVGCSTVASAAAVVGGLGSTLGGLGLGGLALRASVDVLGGSGSCRLLGSRRLGCARRRSARRLGVRVGPRRLIGGFGSASAAARASSASASASASAAAARLRRPLRRCGSSALAAAATSRRRSARLEPRRADLGAAHRPSRLDLGSGGSSDLGRGLGGGLGRPRPARLGAAVLGCGLDVVLVGRPTAARRLGLGDLLADLGEGRGQRVVDAALGLLDRLARVVTALASGADAARAVRAPRCATGAAGSGRPGPPRPA